MPKRVDEFESNIARVAAHYLNLKAEEKGQAAALEKHKKTLREALYSGHLNTESYDGHVHAILTLQDGTTQIKVKDQNSDRVSKVDNIVDLLREKLGDEAESYIVKTETIQDKALEQLFAAGKISEDDLREWTVVKSIKSLIVEKVKK
jgi:hypothetical protein